MASYLQIFYLSHCLLRSISDASCVSFSGLCPGSGSVYDPFETSWISWTRSQTGQSPRKCLEASPRPCFCWKME